MVQVEEVDEVAVEVEEDEAEVIGSDGSCRWSNLSLVAFGLERNGCRSMVRRPSQKETTSYKHTCMYKAAAAGWIYAHGSKHEAKQTSCWMDRGRACVCLQKDDITCRSSTTACVCHLGMSLAAC
jgi:hypothetical protein